MNIVANVVVADSAQQFVFAKCVPKNALISTT